MRLPVALSVRSSRNEVGPHGRVRRPVCADQQPTRAARGLKPRARATKTDRKALGVKLVTRQSAAAVADTST